ncbi:MAG TPA: hypothetical protein VNB06_18785 [Thermoanaerobaculia bacterium]|nr:hypothetical protein [Thermoanaerobaculia bacterium]
MADSRDPEAQAWEEWDRAADVHLDSPFGSIPSGSPDEERARQCTRQVAASLAELDVPPPPEGLVERIVAALPSFERRGVSDAEAHEPDAPVRLAPSAGTRIVQRRLPRSARGDRDPASPRLRLGVRPRGTGSTRPIRETPEREGNTTMTQPARRSNRRVVLIAALGVAAIGLALALTVNREAPTPEETAGAIGGVERAERYRGETLAETDITLDAPEVQEIVQSDEFQEILSNPELREAFASDAMRAVLANDQLRAVFANDFLRNALANDRLRNVLANDQLRAALAAVLGSDQIRGGFGYGNAGDQSIHNDAIRAVFANDALRGVLANDQQRAVFASDKWRNVIAADELRAVLANDSLRAALASDAVRAVFANDQLRAVFASDALRGVFANDQARAALANDSLRAVFANDHLRNALASDAFRNVLANDRVRNIMANDRLRNVFASDAMRNAIANDSLRAARGY